MESHFHILTASLLPSSSKEKERENKETCYGLSFAHEKVAERFHQVALQLMPTVVGSKTVASSQLKQDSISAMMSSDTEEMTDNPPLYLSSKLPAVSYRAMQEAQEEEAGALTCSGHFPLPIEDSYEEEKPMHTLQVSYGGTSEEEGLEDVDLGGQRLSLTKPKRNKEKQRLRSTGSREWMCSSSGNSRSFLDSSYNESRLKRRSESMHEIRISYPSSFKHLAHVHPGTPFHDLKQVINTGVSPLSSPKPTKTCSDDKVKIRHTPSIPNRLKAQRHNSLPPNFPTILVTPATYNRQAPYPPPPPPVSDFKQLLEELQMPKTNEGGLTDSMEVWQVSFQSAVEKIVEKKLQNESKLWSLTAQSGRTERNEREDNRVPSVIVHDHGVVYL